METMKKAPARPEQIDPREAGFDPARLERIDRHFRRYVEDGRLAGCSFWSAAAARSLTRASMGSATGRRGCRWSQTPSSGSTP